MEVKVNKDIELIEYGRRIQKELDTLMRELEATKKELDELKRQQAQE